MFHGHGLAILRHMAWNHQARTHHKHAQPVFQSQPRPDCHPYPKTESPPNAIANTIPNLCNSTTHDSAHIHTHNIPDTASHQIPDIFANSSNRIANRLSQFETNPQSYLAHPPPDNPNKCTNSRAHLPNLSFMYEKVQKQM
jgi:hypothetical protein